MGSGHFLVFALPILARLRMEEEDLSAADAVAAVLRDNLHGLEIDERCTQIAAFNVALTAWKLGGYQVLPEMHLACSGLAPNVSKAEWMALADHADFLDVNPDRDVLGVDDNLFSASLRAGMGRVYDLFQQAPVLGSLIDPSVVTGDLFSARFEWLEPILAQALTRNSDAYKTQLYVRAEGISQAGRLLAGQYVCIVTNVPFLSGRKQHQSLQQYCTDFYPDAKNDVAVVFFLRSLACLRPSGCIAVVMSQYWLFKSSYADVRAALLKKLQWQLIANWVLAHSRR
jgi:hypothetical protein